MRKVNDLYNSPSYLFKSAKDFKFGAPNLLNGYYRGFMMKLSCRQMALG